MYLLKEEYAEMFKTKYVIKTMANQLHYSQSYLSLIFNRHKSCSIKTAESITKYINSDANVEDYFEILVK